MPVHAPVGTPIQFLPDSGDTSTVVAGVVRAMGVGSVRSLLLWPLHSTYAEATVPHVDDAAPGEPGWREIPGPS